MNYLDTPLYIYIPICFFVYGLSFIILGITIAIERLTDDTEAGLMKSLLSSSTGFLALFGIIYGLYELFGMFLTLNQGTTLLSMFIRLLLMSTSFFFLFKFGVTYSGAQSRDNDGPRRQSTTALPSGSFWANAVLGLWAVLCLVFLIRKGFCKEWLTISEILARYLIGAPGAFLASFALLTSGKGPKPASRKYRIAASISFALYAMGDLVVQKADFFPASWLNYETFYGWTHFPMVVLRALCAVAATFSVLRLLRLSRDFVSIRLKAIWHVMIVVAIPTLCIVLLVCYLAGDALLRSSYKEHETITSLIAHNVYSSVSDAADDVKDSLVFHRPAPALVRRDIFVQVVAGNMTIRGMTFIDEKGELLRVYRDPETSSVNYESAADGSRIDRFLRGFRPEMPRKTYYLSGHDKDNITVTLPSKKGRIDVLLDLKRIYMGGAASELREGRRIVILDADGESVFPPTRPPPGSGDVRARSAFEPGIYGRKVIVNGNHYNIIEEEMHSTGWSVIMEIPRKEIVAPIFGLFKVLLAGVLVVNLFSVVGSVFFVERVTKPVNLIARRVKSIGTGDFSSGLSVRTGDELQVLSEEVEKMALQLAEKKKMEKQIVQTEKLASLGRLVAGVAHEINNPLGIILGYSQLLQRECGPQGRLCEDLKTVEKHALACKNIVEDLLKFSRTSKQMNLEVDIATSIRETLSLVEKHFSKGNVAITLQTDPKLPGVQGDPDKLRQLFLNLALNALDVMKDGGSLTVGVRSLETEGEKGVEITFTDTGPGIAQGDIERVFEPFFTTKEVGKGTGLGLSVSYGIVTGHGGRIWVESEAGKGATFHVMLPAMKKADGS